MDFIYDEISEALGEEEGYFDAAEFEENMSTHYGRRIHLDDRTIMFAIPEDAAKRRTRTLRPLVLGADTRRCRAPAMSPAAWTSSTAQRHTRHMAGGPEFREFQAPAHTLTRLVGVFQDHRTRPLCEPSRRLNLPYLLASSIKTSS